VEDHLEIILAAVEDAERRSVKDELVRLWLKRLKDAAVDRGKKRNKILFSWVSGFHISQRLHGPVEDGTTP
jgi:hypothetical protein